MLSSYVPKHFAIEELIPPLPFMPKPLGRIYNADKNSLFRLFDYRVLVTLDRLRGRYGSCSVNNWHHFPSVDWYAGTAGQFRFSGWRPFDCKEGAGLSEHKFFRAMDCKFRDVTPSEIWDDMLADINAPEFEFIQRIEAFSGMSWFHFDMGQHRRFAKSVHVISDRGNRAGLPMNIERV